MSFIIQRRLSSLAGAALLLSLSLFGCAMPKPMLGTKPPAMALTDAKTTLLKADQENAVIHAPLEMERAKAALNEGEKLWSKYKRRSGSTGVLKYDDKIREKALYTKLYAQIAQAINNQEKIEQQLAKTEIERLKYDSLKRQYQAEEAQVRVIITKQQKLEAERQAAEMRAQQEAQAKEDAQKYALLAEAAKKEALLQMALAKQAKEEAQRQKAEAEAATLAALRAKQLAQQQKKEAEAARLAALRAKELAEISKQEALREKQLAEAAKLEAQQEAAAAKQRLQELQNKLTLLSAEFAKVKQEKRGLVVTLSDILFDVDMASIRPGAAKNLKQLAQILKEYPDRKILVEGHTDSTGSTEHNQTLSEERSFAVMGYLMSQGLEPKKMDAKGFGETKPVASNETAAGRQQNRRVDIIILNPQG